MSRKRCDDVTRDPLWYKDSTIYQLHVKSFCDSDGDGIGDFRGALQKIDYIADLGVDAIWLLPFYPSPRRDDGYDIADYRGVHPDYGTMSDLRAFIDAAHARWNQGCWSEVWLMTSSTITCMLRSWAAARNSLKSSSVP
jgi:maltose alpha-D-glucosyltransferase/alpha-amylase